MPEKKKSVFDNLFAINANEFKEKKGRYDYLSWSDALAYILKEYPDTTWDVHEFSNGEGFGSQPYMSTDAGCFVKVSVTIEGITRTEIHAVMDNFNKSIKEPNAVQINNSIKRCLVKCFALFGLGLYIYQGEDLPEVDKPKPLNDSQYKQMMSLVANKSAKYKQQLAQAIKQEKINSSNFEDYFKKLMKDAEKPKKEEKKNVD